MKIKLGNIARSPIQLLHIQLEKDQQLYGLTTVHRNGHAEKYAGDDFDELLVNFKSSQPVAIIIEGSGILYRNTENSPNYLDSILVGGNKNDFFINEIEHEGFVGLSLIRKQTIQEIIDKLNFKGHSIQHILVGSLFQFLIENRTKLTVQITFNATTGFQFTKTEPNLSFEKLKENLSDNFGKFYFESTGSVNFKQAIDLESFVKIKKQFKDKNLFKRLGAGILVFFLSALLINYFVVNHLNQQVATKEAELAVFGENFSLLSRLEQEQQRKMALIENSSILKNHFNSFYMDRIGKSVPVKIQLTELQLYPLLEPLKPKQRVDIDKTTILIYGFSENSIVLDQWISKLETFPWIRSVEVLNFSRIHSTKSSFSISIHLIP